MNAEQGSHQGYSENPWEPESVSLLKGLRSQEAVSWAGQQCFNRDHSIHGDDREIPTGTSVWVVNINEEQ